MSDSLVTPTLAPEEIQLDTTLRPQTLGEFVGQEHIKENLRVFLGAAKARKEPCEHVLLYGNPGLGKTTLAYLIAREMSAQIRTTSGPMLERVGDLAAILTNLQEGDILFIDEIHRLNKVIEEVLYPAMEEYALDIVIGKGPGARTLRMNIPRFTLIGATTRASLLSGPFRDRFGATHHLDFYRENEIAQILERSARILEVTLEESAQELIAARARRTPRVANRLLKRVRDYAQVESDGVVTHEIAEKALTRLDVDGQGLDRVDRAILGAIIGKFSGGPVGLNTLAAATGEEEETIEMMVEPYLMQIGFLERTPRGRMATEAAYKHLGRGPLSREQRPLFNQMSEEASGS